MLFGKPHHPGTFFFEFLLHFHPFSRFDETFDILLTAGKGPSADPNAALVDLDSAFLHLTVKDRGVMGEGIFLGEAYLPLKDIVSSDIDVRLEVRNGFE